MESRIEITEAEILEELLNSVARRHLTEGITTIEIADARRVSKGEALRIVKQLVAAGKLRPAMVVRGPEDGPHWLFRVPVKGYVRV